MVNIEKLEKHLNNNIKEAKLSKEKILEGFANVYDVPNRPLSFLFSGDTASGKTYIAQIVAEFMKEHYDYDIVSYEMSNYVNYNQDMHFIGLDRGYGQAHSGELTTKVYNKSKTVIILENFDKAHYNIQRIFKNILINGTVRDSFGILKKGEKILTDEYGDDEYEKTLTKDNYDKALEQNKIVFDIDFSETIIIITTKLGEAVYTKPKFVEKLSREDHSVFDMLLESISSNSNYPDNQTENDNDRTPKGISPDIKTALSVMNLVPVFPIGFKSTIEVMENELIKRKEIIEKKFEKPINIENLNEITKALILSCGPDFNISKIKKISIFRLFDPIIDSIRVKNNISKIYVSINKTSINNLNRIIKENKNNEIFKVLFKKSLRVALKTIKTVKNNVLNINIIINKDLEKATRAEDYHGKAGSLVFDIPNVSFSDIAGHKRAKKQLMEIIHYLKNPKKLKSFGIKMSKGMLLYGPPGTGKTMLAKAFAKEAKLPFISVTGSELLNQNLLKDIFKKAYKYAPSVIFIDEIDAFGSRDKSDRDIIINQFLTEIDGFSNDPEEHVFIIAATNLKEKLDPAILRSGRIDIHIEIPILDKESRLYFIDKILQKPTVGKIDREKLAMLTAGFSGADLEKIARQASLEAIRKNLKGITEDIIIEQINILKYGEKLKVNKLDRSLQDVAFHEAGHAVISKILFPDVKIEQVVITPRNNSLGFVAFNFEEDFKNYTFEDLKNKMCIAYAGRVSQIKKFGDSGLDSGASSDLDYAMRYAYVAIAHFGMDEELGYINSSSELKLSKIEEKIQDRMLLLINKMKKRTEKLVNENWDKIETIAKVLMEEEFIDGEEFCKYIN